mgnify:FL=1
MGAAIISERLIDNIKNKDGSQPFTNGYTYSCHPVAAKAALTNIDIMSRDGILEHVRKISPHFQNRLRSLGKEYDIIGDARGVGLLGCLEGLGSKNSSEEARLKIDTEFGQMMDEACEKRGLLVRPIINMCVFSPPLIITQSEIDDMFDILEDAIVEVQQNYS